MGAEFRFECILRWSFWSLKNIHIRIHAIQIDICVWMRSYTFSSQWIFKVLIWILKYVFKN